MDTKDKMSLLTEWILKYAVIFFVASLFFDSFIIETLGQVDAFQLGFLIKIILVLIFGILLSVLEKNLFKVVAFATVIVGSAFKILITLGQSEFSILNITDLADYVLIITISIYYLQRHFRKSRHYRSSSAKKLSVVEEEVNDKNH